MHCTACDKVFIITAEQAKSMTPKQVRDHAKAHFGYKPGQLAGMYGLRLTKVSGILHMRMNLVAYVWEHSFLNNLPDENRN